MTHAPSLLAPALLALLAGVASAGTLTVGPAGSGAAYDDLAQAVAAAQPGDTLLVAAGQYVHPGSLVVDKPLTILGAGSASTTLQAMGGVLDQPVPLVVRDLAAGEEVRIVGLTLRSLTLGGYVGSAFRVQDCQGPVVLSDISGGSFTLVYNSPGLGQVHDSDQVLLDGCDLRVVATSQLTPPTPGLSVEGSSVYLNGCELLGGSRGQLLSQGAESDGAPGIRAQDSVLRLSRSKSVGGPGTLSSPFFTTAVPTRGGAGLEATGCQVLLRGGVGSQLQGGVGRSGFSGGVLTPGAGAGAVEADNASLVTSTPDVALFPGADSTGLVTTPSVAGGAVYVPLTVALATLGSDAKLVTPGAVLGLELGGEPGALALTWFAFSQGPATAVPGVLGEVVLDLSTAAPLAPATLDASGAAGLSVPTPALPALAGTSVLVQTFTAGPSGTASLSAPTFVGLR